MNMLHAMQAFVRVVDAGSFTAAAQQAESSTAQVSRLVADLENHLQARLLHRTTRRLALTETGEAFLLQCRQILEQIDDACAQASGSHLTPRGNLRVHALTGLGIQLLATLAGRYSEQYPEVNIELVLSQRQPDLLAGDLDVVITLSRELPDSELIAQPLGSVSQVVCAAPQYLKQHGVPSTPAELQAHRCLQLVDPAFTDTWRFLTDKALSGDDLFVVVPGKTFKVNVAEAMSSAAEAGMGICLLPDYVAASALQRGSLVRLLPHFHLQEKTLYALYPSRRFLDAKVRTWVDFLKQQVPQQLADYHQIVQNPEYWARENET